MGGIPLTVVRTRVDPIGARAEWLEWRRDGIGGSDIAGLLGLSRFSSPMSVYYDKLALVADDEGTEAMLWGKLLEEPIAAEFARRTGLHVIDQQVAAVNPARPWERCTLDGLVAESPTSRYDDALGVIEIKNSSDFSWDSIPDEYAVQVQWQLGIAERERAWLVVLHGGRRLAIYEVGFDAGVFADLRRVAGAFWHDHVLPKVPPPADGSPATTDALKDAYRDLADGTTVELDDDTAALAVEWLARKAAVSTAELELERVTNALRVALGEHTIGAHDGVELVTWKPQATGARFDREALERDHPLIAAQYMGAKGTTRVLRSTKHLKELAAL